jgi:hypothetical protein
MKQKEGAWGVALRIIRQTEGQTAREACREPTIPRGASHRWKRKYGGPKFRKSKGFSKL